MAIAFPTSPTVNQVFTSSGSSWIWNGNYWQSRGSGVGTFTIPTSYLIRRQSFTATGSSANFTLTVTPNSVANLMVYIAGVEQPSSSFSLSGSVVTLTPTPAANAVVEILDFSSGAVLGAINRSVQNFVATEGQTLILSATQFVPTLTDLFINGILQSSNQYTTASSGYSITMLYGLAAGDLIRLVAYTTVAPDPVGFVVKRQNYLVASTQTVFTVSAGYRPGYIDVYVNGVRLIDGVGFTAVDGQTLSLTSAATVGQRVEVQSYVTSTNQIAGTSTSYVSRKYTGDGTTTTFLVSTPLLSTNSVLVFKNGLLQLPVDDYNVVGSQVVFVTAPALNTVIHIRELPV